MSKHWHHSVSQLNHEHQALSAHHPCPSPALQQQPGTSSILGAQAPLDCFDLWYLALCQALPLSLHQLQPLPVQAELRPAEELQQGTRDGHEDKEVKAALAKSWLQGHGRLQLRLGTHHVVQGVALEDVVSWCQRRVCENGAAGMDLCPLSLSDQPWRCRDQAQVIN